MQAVSSGAFRLYGVVDTLIELIERTLMPAG
jgi:hypothetical protein